MIIKPSVGRVVHYYPPGRKNAEPQAAIITKVHEERVVNLAIFNEAGQPVLEPPTSILLVQEGDDAPDGGGYCGWMPYQQEKAKQEAAASPVKKPESTSVTNSKEEIAHAEKSLPARHQTPQQQAQAKKQSSHNG